MSELPPRLSEALGNLGDGLAVAVIRLGAMGDILRTIPPVRLIRRGLPRAKLVWILEEQWNILIEGHPDLDQVISVPRREFEKLLRGPAGWPRLPGAIHRLRKHLQEPAFDLAIDFHGNLRSGLVCRLTGAPVRLGYGGHQQKEGNHWLTTDQVASGERRTPRMERNLELVRHLGIEDRPLPDGGLPLIARGAEEAAVVLRQCGIDTGGYVIVSPGASRAQAYKKPPAALLGAACGAAVETGLSCLIVHGPGEEEDARRTVDTIGAGAILAPPTSLATLAALLRKASLFIGGDSGPLHMACAVGCPVLGVYGPTDPVVNQPWGVPYRAVFPPDRAFTGIKKIDREAGGFKGLAPDRVRSAAAELLRETADRKER